MLSTLFREKGPWLLIQKNVCHKIIGVVRGVSRWFQELFRADGGQPVITTIFTFAALLTCTREWQTAGQGVPLWLKSLDSPPAESTMPATFAMHCYWVGEAQLGALDGVIATRSAWVGEKEVVQLVYDPQTIDYETLVESALKMECASTVYTHNDEQNRKALSIVDEKTVEAITDDGQIRDAKSSDQKYSLANSNHRFLPLNEIQAVKVNAILASENRKGLSDWISPRQQVLMKRIDEILKRDPESLNQLVRPENEEALAQYATTLESALSNK